MNQERSIECWGNIEMTEAQKEIIRREENEFPKLFTLYHETEYGILFYNENNKDSYDSNHAVIYPERIKNLSDVLRNIVNFYKIKNITPLIYHPFVKGYFEKNEKTFLECGFKITTEESHCVSLLSEKSRVVPNGTIEIQKLTKWDERIAKDILIPNKQHYEALVCEESMKHVDNHVFVGYKNGKAVVYVIFHVSLLGCTRFDFIVTAKEERGNGYARQIMHRVSDYCHKEKLPLCATWFANPTSERLNYEVGFRPTDFYIEAGYASYVEKTNINVGL